MEIRCGGGEGVYVCVSEHVTLVDRMAHMMTRSSLTYAPTPGRCAARLLFHL